MVGERRAGPARARRRCTASRTAACRRDGALLWDVAGAAPRDADRARAVAAGGPLDGIGIDSWAVDYGLLDATGALLGNPLQPPRPRTDGVRREGASAEVGAAELYAVNGLQQLPFNTIYQLVAAPARRSSTAAGRCC